MDMDAEELLNAAAETDLPPEDVIDVDSHSDHIGVQADFTEDSHSEPVGVQVDFSENNHSDPVGVQVDFSEDSRSEPVGVQVDFGDSHCDPIDPGGDVGVICNGVASTDYQLCATVFSGTGLTPLFHVVVGFF